MAVSGDANIRTATVDAGIVRAKLSGTPINADDFLYFAGVYHIDPNWALAYLQWESAFGTSAVSQANPTNPWDILSSPGQWGQVGEYAPGSGYRYATYPDERTGLEAGFRLWDSYASRGWDTWLTSLSVALCGDPGGCASGWAQSVIRQGQSNEGTTGYGDDGVVVTLPGIGPVSGPVAIGMLLAAGVGVLLIAGRRRG